MENIIAILKSTQGIFFNALNLNEQMPYTNGDISYIGIEKDKQNLRSDILNVLSDFNNATKEAKPKQSIWQ
jgi:hypothetical protein